MAGHNSPSIAIAFQPQHANLQAFVLQLQRLCCFGSHACAAETLAKVRMHKAADVHLTNSRPLCHFALQAACELWSVQVHQAHSPASQQSAIFPLQVTPVTAGLDDRHPYVRRTAVMGVLKIWHMNAGTLAHSNCTSGSSSSGISLLWLAFDLHCLCQHALQLGEPIWQLFCLCQLILVQQHTYRHCCSMARSCHGRMRTRRTQLTTP
jgi:hypothetical protein